MGASKADAAAAGSVPAILYNKPSTGLLADAAFGLLGLGLVVPFAGMSALEEVFLLVDKPVGALINAVTPKAVWDAESRVMHAVAKRIFKDEREVAHTRSMFLHLGIAVPCFFALHAVKWHYTSVSMWALMYVYMQVVGVEHWLKHSGGHDHMEGHSAMGSGWYKPGFEWLVGWTQYIMLPMVGRVPEDDAMCHVFVHHKFCNNLDDVECHLWYNRLSGADFFLRYTPRQFFWRHLHMGHLAYFRRAGFPKHAFKVQRGLLWYAAVVAVSAAINPWACAFIFFAMTAQKNAVYGAGEWGMHAFSNPNVDKVFDPLPACTTLLDEADERERYHAVHHAFNTAYNPANKNKEVERQPLMVAAHKSIPIQIANLSWKELFINLMTGNVDALADNWVLPKGSEVTRDQLKEYIVKSCEPIDLSTVEGKSQAELESRNFLGPVHFNVKEAQARLAASTGRAAAAS